MDLIPSIQSVAGALGFGVVHALTPCAHSWPILLPIVARTRNGVRPGIFFGAGMLGSSLVVGAVLGGLGDVVDEHLEIVLETIIGIVVALLGLVLLVRPQWMHGGHMHGECSPGGDGKEEPHCSHAGHHPGRFMRLGPDLGAAVLGVANMALPCWSNVMGVSFSVEAGSAAKGAIVLGCYGLTAGVTTIALLVLFRHGMRLTEKLTSARFEGTLMRITGVLMAGYGVVLALHLGHQHAH